MWNDFYPISEMIEIVGDGVVWRQPVFMEEGLKVCEFCLCKEHDSEECKQEGCNKEK